MKTTHTNKIKKIALKYGLSFPLKKNTAPKERGRKIKGSVRYPIVFKTIPRPEYTIPVRRMPMSRGLNFLFDTKKINPTTHISPSEIVTPRENC